MNDIFPIFFTVINPDNEEEQQQIVIEAISPEDKTFAINGLEIDSQQLAELGMLFFALACKDADLDSCFELLHGFNIPVPKNALLELAGE